MRRTRTGEETSPEEGEEGERCWRSGADPRTLEVCVAEITKSVLLLLLLLVEGRSEERKRADPRLDSPARKLTQLLLLLLLLPLPHRRLRPNARDLSTAAKSRTFSGSRCVYSSGGIACRWTVRKIDDLIRSKRQSVSPDNRSRFYSIRSRL